MLHLVESDKKSNSNHTCTYMYMYNTFVLYHLLMIVNNYIISSETFGFLVYHLPMNVTVTVSEAEAGVTFYYIAATDGNTRILPDFSGSINFDTFSVVYTGSKTMSLAIRILKGDDGVDDSRVSFTITVIGMLILLMGVVSIRALELKPRCGMIQFRFTLLMLQFNSSKLKRFQFHSDSIPITASTHVVL